MKDFLTIRNKIYFFIAIVAFVAFLSIGLYPFDRTSDWFVQENIPLKGYNLFDLGVVDLNEDNILDIYTTNHNSLSSLMLGNKNGEFSDIVSQWKFDHNPEYPGLADSNIQPKINKSGLYIYWYQRTLYIRSYNVGNKSPIKGTIALLSPIVIKKHNLAKVEITEQKTSDSEQKNIINFEIQNDGLLAIAPRFMGLPISFKIHDNLPLNQIYLGSEKIPSKFYSFDLPVLRDRHSISWADYNGDGNIDAFVTRSGLRGSIERFRSLYSRHLLSGSKEGFTDSTGKSGLAETGCRSVQASWVDFNQDDQLELYAVCLDGTSRLYKQENDGSFSDIAVKVGLSVSEQNPSGNWAENGSFIWLDVDADGDQDLLRSYKNKLRLYINQDDLFKETIIGNVPGLTNEFSVKFSQFDFDLDGDIDIFIASGYGNTMLLNTGGKYQITEATKFGLPATGLTANWVDYDNDGLSDIYVVPWGLYRQKSDHTFKKTSILENEFSDSFPLEPRATWFDVDNDGTRDLLIATLIHKDWKAWIYRNLSTNFPWLQKKLNPHVVYDKLKKQRFESAKHELSNFVWTSRLYRNKESKNHWLQVKLIGSSKNRQAIGAKVIVSTSNGQQLQEVGNANSSMFSQGNYRLYFGLGQNRNVESVRVIWSDGQIQEIKNLLADQLLLIEKETQKS